MGKYNTYEELVKAINQKGVTVVMTSSEWCPPCEEAKKYVPDICQNVGIRFVVINIDEDRESKYARRHRISSIPHFQIYEDGKVIRRWSGWTNEEKFMKQIKSVI